MTKNENIAVDFINTYFNPHVSWNEVQKYVHGDGGYQHQLLDLSSIRASFEALNGPFRAAFPDLMQTIAEVATAASGKIIIKTISTATFTNDYAGFNANHHSWRVPVFWEIEIVDGKIKFASEVCNHHAINKQLGIVFFKDQFLS
jgi:hypothetical protein